MIPTREGSIYSVHASKFRVRVVLIARQTGAYLLISQSSAFEYAFHTFALSILDQIYILSRRMCIPK